MGEGPRARPGWQGAQPLGPLTRFPRPCMLDDPRAVGAGQGDQVEVSPGPPSCCAVGGSLLLDGPTAQPHEVTHVPRSAVCSREKRDRRAGPSVGSC